MSFVTYLRGLFRRSSGVRNRVGGLAWINAPGMQGGLEVLHGHVVTTVRRDADGYWKVEPRQRFLAKAWVQDGFGKSAPPGALVTVARISDDALEPIRDTGVTTEEVERLYQSSPAPQPKQPA